MPKYTTTANSPIQIRAGYDGLWFYPTDPEGTYGTIQRTIWDSAYGTFSGEFPYVNGGGNVIVDGKDYTNAVKFQMQAHEQEVYNSVVALSKAKTHGYMKNIDTGEIKKFQFNPETFEYSRSVTYADNVAPGMAYPKTQFVHGDAREFDVELFMYDRQLEPCGIIKDYINFIGQFLTPEENVAGYLRPPQMLFFYGYFVRKCVLTNLNIKIETFDTDGTPTQARITMTLRQVGVV